MERFISRALAIGSLLVALMLTAPAQAGGNWSKRTGQSGHAVRPNGAAIFHGGTRTLADGVGIFRRGTRNLPDGVKIFHRRKTVSHPDMHKPRKRKHAGTVHAGRTRHLALPGKAHKRKVARSDVHRRAKKHHSGKRRKRHGKVDLVYGSTVYVEVPKIEYIYPEHEDEENCRYLTERGYDVAGRRVLVEWTLCFNEQGEAFVPGDGHRIVARY